MADELLLKPDYESAVRFKKDIELLKEAAKTVRFGNVGLSYYKNVLIPEEETQFSAVSFYLDEGTVFLAFRGTDKSLTGWKEDFNMSFQESIPSQRMALLYLQEFCESCELPIYLGGHSKGCNLAVYASVKCGKALQEQILKVYNHDGPGFTENLMGLEDYIHLVPKILTYVPQSSLIGMLLEHEEPYIVIKSNSIGVLQHDSYTWEVMGADFVMMEELTSDAKFLDKTIKRWMASMTPQERDQFIDTIFDIMESEGVDSTDDIMKPRNLVAYFKTLHSDEEVRGVLAKEVVKLLKASGVDISGTKNRIKEMKHLKDFKTRIKAKLSKVKQSMEKRQEIVQEELIQKEE